MNQKIFKTLIAIVFVIIILILLMIFIFLMFFNKNRVKESKLSYSNPTGNIAKEKILSPKEKAANTRNTLINIFNKRAEIRKNIDKINYDKLIEVMKEKPTEFDSTIEIKINGINVIKAKLYEGLSDISLNKLKEAIVKKIYDGADVIANNSRAIVIGNQETSKMPLWTSEINEEKNPAILPIRGTIVTNSIELESSNKDGNERERLLTGGNISIVTNNKEVDDFKMLFSRRYPKKAVEAFLKEGGDISHLLGKEVVLGYIYEGMDELDKLLEKLGNKKEKINIEYIKLHTGKSFN